ncbi:hypothetical protein CI710_11930 [Aeromonas salmonicida]|nr:hypothetical protein CI710_11930 [Aeromonas salmonicida]
MSRCDRTSSHIIWSPPCPPAPSTFHCPKCDWSKTTVPHSDALLRGHDWFDSCLKCQCNQLERHRANPV